MFSATSTRTMALYKRSKLGLDAISRYKITIPKTPVQNPALIIDHFTSISNHPTNVTRSSLFTSVTVQNTSHFRCLTTRNISCFGAWAGVAIGGTIFMHSSKFETVPYTRRRRRRLVSHYHDFERSKGEQQFQKMKADVEEDILPEMSPESVKVRKVLNDILEGLERRLKLKELEGIKWETSHLQGLKWEVLVVKNHTPYACCFSCGKIVVHTGLLEHLQTDDIATMVGNEVAHIVAKHHAEWFSMVMFWFGIVDRISDNFVKPKFIKKLYDLIPRYLPFNRRMEIEADHIGLLLMAVGGYDPRAAPKILEKMGKLWDDPDEDSVWQDYFSTCPSVKTRSKMLSKASVMWEAISIYQEAKKGREVDT